MRVTPCGRVCQADGPARTRVAAWSWSATVLPPVPCDNTTRRRTPWKRGGRQIEVASRPSCLTPTAGASDATVAAGRRRHQRPATKRGPVSPNAARARRSGHQAIGQARIAGRICSQARPIFSKDEDLQDDLKLSNVRMALDHWSGIKRMPPEIYSKRLETDRRVNAVYPKLKLLQSVCMQANMKVPLDHMLDGRSELDSYALTTCFGADF